MLRMFQKNCNTIASAGYPRLLLSAHILKKVHQKLSSHMFSMEYNNTLNITITMLVSIASHENYKAVAREPSKREKEGLVIIVYRNL